MKKAGFTLIELMMVIALIAIVAIISTPIVLNVIKDSKEGAFVDSANSLISSVRNYQIKEGIGDLTVTFKNDAIYNSKDQDITNNIPTKGQLPDSGTIHLDAKGKADIALWNKDLKLCITKAKDTKEIAKKRDVNSC